MTVSARLRLLLSRRSILLALGLALVPGLIAPFLPLASVPGFESALIATGVVAILGGVLGIAAARQERELARAGRLWQASSTQSALAAYAAALLIGLLFLFVWAGAAFLHGVFATSCSATLGLDWYLLLPLPSLGLATATGLLVGFLAGPVWAAASLYALVLLLSAARSLLPLWRGPQVFFFDHFLGHVPGPIYDEFLRITPELWTFRLFTFFWIVAALGCAVLARRRFVAGADGSPLRALSLSVLALAAVNWGHAHRHELGFEQSSRSVAETLGGRLEGAHCALFHPREIPSEEAERLLLQCELRMEELGRFFGVEPGHAEVFLHRSAEEKSRLVGAARTQFAKPWLGQVHIDRRGFPHPVLDHELAHLVTAKLGRGPFGVSASLYGLLPLPGLIEGAAVAADWPGGNLSVEEEARAMRDLGLAPDLEKILGAFGFWTQPAARAYTYAGAFIRWLIETRGAEAFAQAYRSGDFEGAYGEPLRALAASWEVHLDGLPVSPKARALAEVRLRRPSIFGQSCAREVAALREDARTLHRGGDAVAAAGVYRQIVEAAPHDGGALLAEASSWLSAREGERVWALAEEGEKNEAPPRIRARLWLLAGDAVASEDAARAALAFERASALPLGEGDERGLSIRREAVGDPLLAEAVLPYLRTGAIADLFAVREVLAERPDWASGWYLLGRRLHQAERHPAAIRAFDRALEAELPALLEREARILRALSLMWEGEGEACRELETLAEEGQEGQRIQARKLLSLCRAALQRG